MYAQQPINMGPVALPGTAMEESKKVTVNMVSKKMVQ